uniref:Uncharacterized protein n=1 Tax=Anopheles minimus TaxID=112268 RepID=A0A182WQC5_9DIPT
MKVVLIKIMLHSKDRPCCSLHLGAVPPKKGTHGSVPGCVAAAGHDGGPCLHRECELPHTVRANLGYVHGRSVRTEGDRVWILELAPVIDDGFRPWIDRKSAYRNHGRRGSIYRVHQITVRGHIEHTTEIRFLNRGSLCSFTVRCLQTGSWANDTHILPIGHTHHVQVFEQRQSVRCLERQELWRLRDGADQTSCCVVL